MSYFTASQTVRRRAWFSGAVTGTPTAQVYVNNSAIGDPVDGTGAAEEWAFEATLPSSFSAGASVQIVATATVSGSTERIELAAGTIVSLYGDDDLIQEPIEADVSDESKSDIATSVRGELNTGDTTGLGENLANAVRTKLSVATVSVTSPVASDGTSITIVQGDSYSDDDGRAIEWTGVSEDQWPDLTEATLLFGAMSGSTTLSKAVEVVSGTGTQVFKLSLESEETAPLAVSSQYRYDVQASWPSGKVVTLLRGRMEVERSYTAPPA